MESFLSIIIITIFLVLFLALFFILTHLRDLTDEEMRILVNKRRNKQIRLYFSFDRRKFFVNQEFKKKMHPTGKFYPRDDKLYEFPSIAAGLLKGKKHEWIIIAFERNKAVNKIWLNKGDDNHSVSSNIVIEQIASIAKKDNQQSVLIFHNHPNSNPNYYNCTKPSDQDIKSANLLAQKLNDCDLNLVEFICERGMHYQYFLAPSKGFFPEREFFYELIQEDGKSRINNLKLHIERLFE